MERMFQRVCGVDVHKESVVACVTVAADGKKPTSTVRTFEAHTRGLGALRLWLEEEQVEAIGMEGTGIYWRPLFAVLEASNQKWKLIVGNAHHIKTVPGRKTDVKDAQWLASLVMHGLIKPSFVPPPAIRELRDLVRFRRKLIEDRTRAQNRVLKVLQAANIKLDGVASDAFGVSGMAILRKLAEGSASPKEMANLAKGVLRKKIDALEVALEGTLSPVHRAMLTVSLKELDGNDESVAAVDAILDEQVQGHREVLKRLETIPGFDRVMAIAVLAELGPDMSVFPSENHCASWAGVSPGNNESAGKQLSGKSTTGNRHLKTMLCQAAQSAVKTKASYYKDKFHRLKARTWIQPRHHGHRAQAGHRGLLRHQEQGRAPRPRSGVPRRERPCACRAELDGTPSHAGLRRNPTRCGDNPCDRMTEFQDRTGPG